MWNERPKPLKNRAALDIRSLCRENKLWDMKKCVLRRAEWELADFTAETGQSMRHILLTLEN